MSNKFNVGDRVILTGLHLIPALDWPVWGSEYGCVGTVVDVDKGLTWVTWNTGGTRMILSKNLTFYTGQKEPPVSPNLAFLKYKRTRHEQRG
jgi:hypothetical protein